MDQPEVDDPPSLDRVVPILDRTFPDASRRPRLFAVIYSLPRHYQRLLFGDTPVSDAVLTAVLSPALTAECVSKAVVLATDKADELLGNPFDGNDDADSGSETCAGSDYACARVGVRRRNKALMAA